MDIGLSKYLAGYLNAFLSLYFFFLYKPTIEYLVSYLCKLILKFFILASTSVALNPDAFE